MKDKWYLEHVPKLHSIFSDFTDELLLIIEPDDRKVERAYHVLQIDPDLYPYKGQRYVLIGDWVYIVGPRPYNTDGKYILYIEHTLNLNGVMVNVY